MIYRGERNMQGFYFAQAVHKKSLASKPTVLAAWNDRSSEQCVIALLNNPMAARTRMYKLNIVPEHGLPCGCIVITKVARDSILRNFNCIVSHFAGFRKACLNILN